MGISCTVGYPIRTADLEWKLRDYKAIIEVHYGHNTGLCSILMCKWWITCKQRAL